MSVSEVDLSTLGGLLGHFVMSRGADVYQFTHRTAGDVICISRQVLDKLWRSGVTPAEACETLLRPLICAACGRARDQLDWTLCEQCRQHQVIRLNAPTAQSHVGGS